MNASQNDLRDAKMSELVTDIKAGDVVHIAGGCLPHILIDSYESEGLWEGMDGGRPMYVGYALAQLSDFSEADRAAGLPGCHFVRDAQWHHRNPLLTTEGDLVVTDQPVYLLECMLGEVMVVGRVTDDTHRDAAEKRLNMLDTLDCLTEEDLQPRDTLRQATLLALQAWLDERS
jgi:hypothetical protein